MSKVSNENTAQILREEKKLTPTIEEHAKTRAVSAPIFAAVMQSEKWASGKRVPEAVFKKAVETFLRAPMGRR